WPSSPRRPESRSSKSVDSSRKSALQRVPLASARTPSGPACEAEHTGRHRRNDVTTAQPRTIPHPGSTVLISAADREDIRSRLRSDLEGSERRLAALDTGPTSDQSDQMEARRLR